SGESKMGSTYLHWRSAKSTCRRDFARIRSLSPPPEARAIGSQSVWKVPVIAAGARHAERALIPGVKKIWMLRLIARAPYRKVSMFCISPGIERAFVGHVLMTHHARFARGARY